MPNSTAEEQRGRDVFVAGPFSTNPVPAAAIAALFAEAFDPGGDFPFKIAIDFHRPIDVGRFAAMARTHDVANLQIINRASHVAKCTAEAGGRARLPCPPLSTEPNGPRTNWPGRMIRPGRRQAGGWSDAN